MAPAWFQHSAARWPSTAIPGAAYWVIAWHVAPSLASSRQACSRCTWPRHRGPRSYPCSAMSCWSASSRCLSRSTRCASASGSRFRAPALASCGGPRPRVPRCRPSWRRACAPWKIRSCVKSSRTPPSSGSVGQPSSPQNQPLQPLDPLHHEAVRRRKARRCGLQLLQVSPEARNRDPADLTQHHVELIHDLAR